MQTTDLTDDELRADHSLEMDTLRQRNMEALSSATTTLVSSALAARQHHMAQWCALTFGHHNATDKRKRTLRFLEECIELAQALDLDEAEVHKLVSFIYSRPVGDVTQEFGGVMVTLRVLAASQCLYLDNAERTEWTRCQQIDPVKFRDRNAQKDAAGF